MEFDKQYVLQLVQNLLTTHSPTGFTDAVMEKAALYASQLGYHMERDRKGTGFIRVKGWDSSEAVGVCAHTDTLGLMVAAINPSGTLGLTNVGGMLIPTVDGEYCTVFTRDGRTYSGTVLCNSPSVHVYEDARSKERKIENMEVRLDEVVKSKEDAEKLGISAGDFVCIDTKTQATPSGFIKSRFLDDKLGVGVIFGLLKYWKDNRVKPRRDVIFYITVFEEIGYGMTGTFDYVTEMIGVDMGCIGPGLSGTEYDVCICAKDAGGPYDYRLTTELIRLAKDNKLDYAVDVFKFYSSDVTTALRTGGDLRGALIGPGVHASHGMERSHYNGVLNTMRLLAAYL
ncbi:MAG: M42 family metallopeptidase [Clostridiales bacterium]|jgi:putative aminopeptidase FrvX|nr:M42 family metallopeptidase [Clostridiales bacterium]